MKTSRIIAASLLAAAITLAGPGSANAQDKPRPKDQPAVKNPPAEKPMGRKEDGAALLNSARRGAEGEVAKERDMRTRGSRGEVVEMSQLPQAAQDSLGRIFVSGPPSKIEKVRIGNSVVFNAEEEETDTLRQARVLEDGTILEVGTKATTIPPAVQQFIDQRFRGSDATVHEMTLTYYEIERAGERGRSTTRITGAGQPLGFGGLLSSAAPNIPRPAAAGEIDMEEAQKKMKEKQEKLRKAKEEGAAASEAAAEKTP